MSRKMVSLIFLLFLTACNLPGKVSASVPQAWFDMPLPETVLDPPDTCHITAHGASLNGIAAFEVYINGVFSESEPAPASNQTLATIDITCQDLVPGKNIVEIRSQDTSGAWSEFTQTTLILPREENLAEVPTQQTSEVTVPARTAFSTLTATFTPTTVRATSTPTPAATFTPTTVRATSTPIPTATLTPTMIPSYTPTRLPNPTNTPTDACSIYTDERSCIANGCIWATIPGTVPIYECRNP